MRLYTQIVVDEPAEIFDDLYLGLRAGGALRKKRRGEPLTSEEQEALGRWQRLGRARKVVALGAFALGRGFRIYSFATLLTVIVSGALTVPYAARLAAART